MTAYKATDVTFKENKDGTVSVYFGKNVTAEKARDEVLQYCNTHLTGKEALFELENEPKGLIKLLEERGATVPERKKPETLEAEFR